MRLRDENVIEAYEKLHEDIGDEVRAAHTRAGYRNYSIYRDGLDLFAYYESDDPEACNEKIKNEPIMPEFWKQTHPMMKPGQALWFPMAEVFHMD
jgi:L-rhamnose mutarotase